MLTNSKLCILFAMLFLMFACDAADRSAEKHELKSDRALSFIEIWDGPDGESSNSVSYALRFCGNAHGVLSIEGYQSSHTIELSIEDVGDRVKVVFRSDNPGKIGKTFSKGDILFELVKSGNNHLLTHWLKLKPISSEFALPGEYFKEASKDDDIPDCPTQN